MNIFGICLCLLFLIINSSENFEILRYTSFYASLRCFQYTTLQFINHNIVNFDSRVYKKFKLCDNYKYYLHLRFVIKYMANCDHKLAIHKSTPHKHVHVLESSGAMSHSKN